MMTSTSSSSAVKLLTAITPTVFSEPNPQASTPSKNSTSLNVLTANNQGSEIHLASKLSGKKPISVSPKVPTDELKPASNNSLSTCDTNKTEKLPKEKMCDDKETDDKTKRKNPMQVCAFMHV